MRFDYEVRDAEREPDCGYERKWLATGYTEQSGDAVRVVVERQQGAPDESVARCFGHERGHAEQLAGFLRDVMPDQLSAVNRFAVEANAWERWSLGARPIALSAGEHVLDSLNSYRRGLKIDDRQWLVTRSIVESWCGDPALREYEPLEPDPEEPMPCELARDGEELWPRGVPRPASREHRRDAPPEARSELREARDEWLHTEEGIEATRRHARNPSDFAKTVLEPRGWPMEELPAVTTALLMGGD